MSNLVVGRRKGQTIEIGNDIRIDVLSISGGQVRIGILAPRNVAVWRGEIADVIRRDKAKAAGGIK